MVQGIPAAARIPGERAVERDLAGITSFIPPLQLARIGSGRPKVLVSERIALSMFPRPEALERDQGACPGKVSPCRDA